MSIGEVSVVSQSPLDASAAPVQSEVFDAADLQADFFIGRTAVPGVVEMVNEDLAHGQFRANVYIDELGWLPESNRLTDGSERDTDDDHSIRFSTVTRLPGHDHPSVVGVSRLVIKETADQPLPVERYFPEAFGEDLPTGVVEASRFIARYPDAQVQRGIALANIRAMVMHAAEIEAPNIYAVVEEPLARYFGMLHIPYDRITDRKVLDGYGATQNLAIRFDPLEILRTAEKPDLSGTVLARMFAPAARASNGLGYYDLSLENKVA